MAALSIRNVDDALKRALRLRAAQHGLSMEEEARRILRDALGPVSQTQPLGQRLKQRFAGMTDATFELPPRQMPRTPPSWDDAP